MQLKYIIFVLIVISTNIIVSGQNKLEIDSLNSLSKSVSSSEPNQALIFAQEAFQASEERIYEIGKLQALTNMAEIYWLKTELDKAIEYAEQARTLAQELDRPGEYADALKILGDVFRNLGDFDKSTNLLFEALRITERENDKSRTGSTLNLIGFLYFDLGNFEKALDYYSKALVIARDLEDHEGIARGLNNLAASYGSMGDFSDFEKNIKDAIVINKANNNQSWLGVNYSNLGSANLEFENYEEALNYFDLAQSIFKEINQLEKLARVYIGLANTHKAFGHDDERSRFATMAYTLAEDNDLLRMKHLSAQQMHALYLHQGDTSNAYKYFLIESESRDSLEIAKNNTQLAHIELLYDIEKKEHEREVQAQRRNFTITLIIIGLVVSLLFILLLLLRYRLKVKYTRLRQEKLKDELDFKKREMTSNALSLMEKNSTLVEIANKLKEVRDEAAKDETKHAIRRIANLLEKATKQNAWADFEKRFNEVHQDFHNKLHEQFPNLSPNEQRLCAFLKLNMSSKDISALTGQKVESLEKARTRLRKKLGLTNTNINLVSFLSQF